MFDESGPCVPTCPALHHDSTWSASRPDQALELCIHVCVCAQNMNKCHTQSYVHIRRLACMYVLKY